MNRFIGIVIGTCSFVVVALVGFTAAVWAAIGMFNLFGLSLRYLGENIVLVIMISGAALGLGLGYWASRKARLIGRGSIQRICDLSADQIDLILRIWIAASGFWCVSIIVRQFLATDSWSRNKDFYYLSIAYVFSGPLLLMALSHLFAWVIKGKKNVHAN